MALLYAHPALQYRKAFRENLPTNKTQMQNRKEKRRKNSILNFCLYQFLDATLLLLVVCRGYFK